MNCYKAIVAILFLGFIPQLVIAESEESIQAQIDALQEEIDKLKVFQSDSAYDQYADKFKINGFIPENL